MTVDFLCTLILALDEVQKTYNDDGKGYMECKHTQYLWDSEYFWFLIKLSYRVVGEIHMNYIFARNQFKGKDLKYSLNDSF